MDVIQMLGYEKKEVLYESKSEFVCRAKNAEGNNVLIKSLKTEQASIEQLIKLEYEYSLLSEQKITGVSRTCELLKNYKGHILLMEDIGGIPLIEAPIFDSIRKGGTPTKEHYQWILNIFLKMIQSLQRIHENEIIHRDINPLNFLLMPDRNQVFLIDYGCAVKTNFIMEEGHHNKEIVGRLSYISPEQTGRVGNKLDYRSDFYSLGATMYELITGQRPFCTDDPLELVHCNIAKIPESPHGLKKEIPESVSAIIMKLMEKEPDRRYRSETGIQRDIEKCLSQLWDFEVIQPFKLGDYDTFSKFQIPQKLYGRENEKKLLTKSYMQSLQGTTKLILVGGNPGVGKTSLVLDVYRPLAEKKGFFVSGKAEQFQSNSSYYIFMKATKELVALLLQENDLGLMQWKEKLLKALKGNGQIIIDMVPELTAIIGPQQKVSELGPAENENRLLNTYGNFIGVFAQNNCHLTLLLDDLQWCDRPSLELIKYLTLREDLKILTLIGCYRNNELNEGHPLSHLIDEVIKLQNVVRILLEPLQEDQIEVLLCEMFSHEKNEVKQLAEIVYKKSRGNPFFVKKLLSHLYEEQFIQYNGECYKWEWDDKKIAGIAISENVIDMLILQLSKLQSTTQEILKSAAIIGSTFNLKILSVASEIPVDEIAVCLQEAIKNEIIFYCENGILHYNILDKLSDNVGLQFAHDRVQQACVELMTTKQKQELQLKIGRTIRKNTPNDNLREYAMDIVSHLNEGIEWIESEEERKDTARLNLWACQKAKASSASNLALKYIENSVRILSEKSWETDYDFTFEIFKNYAESAYLTNAYELAEKQIEILLDNARSAMEQAGIRLMQSKLCNFLGQLGKAIEYAVMGLKLLKHPVFEKPSILVVGKEMISVKLKLSGKGSEDLLAMPSMKDEKIMLVLKLWNEINSASYLYGNTNLFLMSILKQMQLILKYGNSHDAGKTYVAYAMILAILGDFKGTYEFCDLALKSHEKEESFECRATTLFSSGLFGHAWNRSWCNMEEWFEKAMEEAVKYGDHHTIAMAGYLTYVFKPDVGINVLIEKSMKQLPLVKQTGNQMGIQSAFVYIHRWLNYAGLTDDKYSLSVSQLTYEKNGAIGMVYSEEECLKILHEESFQSILGVYYKEKMYIHYLYDDYTTAFTYLTKSDKYLDQHKGIPYIVECIMCNFLVILANIHTMNKAKLKKNKGRLIKDYKQMKAWAKHCPVNFLHLQYLMEAELAHMDNKVYEAAEFYDKSISTARKNSFIRDEALANELAAKFYLAYGKDKQAGFYFTEAYKVYQLWGASAKTSHMKEKYGHLLTIQDLQITGNNQMPVLDMLDQLSTEKVANIILNETKLPTLLFHMMKTVIENAGAQKAVFILKSEYGWKIVAEALTDTLIKDMPEPVPLYNGAEMLPVSVIHYCIRTGDYLVLDDAANSGNFQKDPYVIKNQTSSILCMPVMNHDSEDGILYLENNLATEVFTHEREQILQELTTQFATSINNIRLFLDLLEKNEEVHKASEEILRSDMAFLQAQIKPHFLYNAINTISAFSLDDSEMARELLTNLSQYLRGSFDFKNRDRLVTINKELEMVEAYLFIEKARFGDRLNIVYQVDKDLNCLLPPLVLQPLVENAVIHGLSERKKGGTVKIAVYRENKNIILAVEDNGDGMDDATYENLFKESTDKTSGVALKNINRRLIQMYGQGLIVKRKETGGTKVKIVITD